MKLARSPLVPVAVSLVVVLLGLECTYRLYAFGPRSLHPWRVKSIQSIGRVGLIQPSERPGLVYELKPDLDTYFKLARFRTNSVGLRDREYGLEKPPETFRVAVIGSSFTMPSGVEIQDAYHSLIEDELNAQSQDTTYEFINFAVAGYGPKMMLATLRERALAYDPDLILYGLTAGVPYFTRRADAYDEAYEIQTEANSFFKPFFLRRLAKLAGRKRRVQEKWADREVSVRAFEESLVELEQLSRERGTPVLAVVLQHRHSTGAEKAQRLVEMLQRRSFTISDTTPAFEGIPLEKVRIHREDEHPNPFAHRIFARIVYGDLVRSSLLPEEFDHEFAYGAIR